MKQCLVIDDSDVIRKVTVALLKDMGLEFCEAENGQDALQRCAERMPDCVLIDWQMPVMAGMEFIASLRIQDGGTKPYVIYCTTENDPIDIARALAAGADDFVLKPFDRETIRAKFTEALAA